MLRGRVGVARGYGSAAVPQRLPPESPGLAPRARRANGRTLRSSLRLGRLACPGDGLLCRIQPAMFHHSEGARFVSSSVSGRHGFPGGELWQSVPLLRGDDSGRCEAPLIGSGVVESLPDGGVFSGFPGAVVGSRGSGDRGDVVRVSVIVLGSVVDVCFAPQLGR